MNGFSRALAGFASVVGALVLAAVVFGMATCIQYDRWKERACMNQGGAIVHNVTPGSGSGSNRDACMRVQVTMTPVVVPGEP